MMFRLLAAMPLLALAACGDEPAAELEEGESEPVAEVLEGSISDDMLPIEQVRSQAPSAAVEGEEPTDESASAPPTSGTAAASGTEPAPEPAVEAETDSE